MAFKIVILNLFHVLCITDLSDKTKVPYTNITYKYLIDAGNNCTRGSRWPRGLRRDSTANVLPGLWVQIPPWACFSVAIVVCCQVDFSTSG
jgi:hypothetical protein